MPEVHKLIEISADHPTLIRLFQNHCTPILRKNLGRDVTVLRMVGALRVVKAIRICSETLLTELKSILEYDSIRYTISEFHEDFIIESVTFDSLKWTEICLKYS